MPRSYHTPALILWSCRERRESISAPGSVGDGEFSDEIELRSGPALTASVSLPVDSSVFPLSTVSYVLLVTCDPITQLLQLFCFLARHPDTCHYSSPNSNMVGLYQDIPLFKIFGSSASGWCSPFKPNRERTNKLQWMDLIRREDILYAYYTCFLLFLQGHYGHCGRWRCVVIQS